MLCSHALITPTSGSRNSIVTASPASIAPTSGSRWPSAIQPQVAASASADTAMRSTNALPSTRAELGRRPIDDGRHEDFGAAHPGDRREHEQQRIGVLPFAERVGAEVAREQAADRDRDDDLRQAFEPEPDDIRERLRDIGVADASQHAARRAWVRSGTRCAGAVGLPDAAPDRHGMRVHDSVFPRAGAAFRPFEAKGRAGIGLEYSRRKLHRKTLKDCDYKCERDRSDRWSEGPVATHHEVSANFCFVTFSKLLALRSCMSISHDLQARWLHRRESINY